MSATIHRGDWTWHNRQGDDGRNDGSIISDAASGRAVCVCKAPQYATPEQWEETAEFITTACNSHDALVEALDRLLSREKDLWAYDEAKGIGLREDIEFADASLSAARSSRKQEGGEGE